MKSLKIPSEKMLVILLTLPLLISCGGNGNTGGHWTEIDSTEDTSAVQIIDTTSISHEEKDFDPNNWREIKFGESSNFDWEEFKNKFQAREEAIGAGFHRADDEITSSWENLNEAYSYQTVYRYRDNGLWLQTYYRKNNGINAADSLNSEERTLLTPDETDTALKGLWQDMEEAAENLKDSIF